MVNKHNFEKYQADLEITIGNNITETIKKLNEAITRGGSRDLKKGDALCRPPWLADEENFGEIFL